MPLESLLELVETLRERIDEHGAALGQSEALTRAALIDPLLRELGWDTEDPAMVMPEYRLGRGYADYALLSNGRPMIMVEAKKLGTPLQDAASQGIGYCIEDGIGHFAVTDGRQWEIYETHKMAPISEKLTVQFNIEQSPPNTCLRAMALWRPAVEQGSVMAAETPLVGLDAVERDAAEPIVPPIHDTEPTPQGRYATQRPPATVSQSGETGQEWVPLSDLSPQGGDAPPVEIQFPDNSRVVLGRWNLIMVESTRWLYTNNYLNATNCRIQRATRYLVSDAPIHPNGKEFTMPSDIGGSLYVEINYSGFNHVKNAQIIIEHADQDPAQFRVRLST